MTTQDVATTPLTPTGLLNKYEADFAAILPSHIAAPTWMMLATGALRRDQQLAGAAQRSPASFLNALLTAARLGLEPGTEQFYLTPRKVKGQWEVLGIIGYQGILELIYRAGAVSSVVAECVYARDRFDYAPGRTERPIHEVDWDLADRGPLRLVYAYAVMKDGATSKVVVMNKAVIDVVKASSASASSDYSPWKTHESAMWLKSAVRQLGKWVPTSAEFVRLQPATAGSAPIADSPWSPGRAPATNAIDVLEDDDRDIDYDTGEVFDGEYLEP